MKPVFVRINRAIEFTTNYYSEHYITEYTLAFTRLAKGQSSSSYMVDHWEELLYDLHQQMEEEIIQIIYTSNQNTQVLMFEELREWLNMDRRLNKEPNGYFFWKVVDDYNEKINKEMEQKLEVEVEKFRSTDEFKNLGENVSYEKEVFPFWSLVSKMYIPFKVTEINRKYYCNELSTYFIDYYEVKKYIELVSKIVNNFRGIVEKHLTLFDTGKYVSLSQMTIEREIIKNSPPNEKLIEAAIQPDEIKPPFASKIDVDLNLEQLLYLFKALHAIGIIKNKDYSDIFDVLSVCFQLASKKPGENISKNKMANKWNNIDAKVIGDWKDRFIDLVNQAKKDNPNNIKSK